MENEILVLVQGAIGLITLVVFFFVSANIAKIKSHFVEPSRQDYTRDIELALFKGDKQKALNLYYELAYIFVKQTDFQKDNARKLEQISVKINDLGGNIPEAMTAFIEKYK
jgi:hypothetical protein